MSFTSSPSAVMHIDLNSCFASVEQQANPLFRGKPLVVAAYVTNRGCILAASVEAKRLGIKTGMRVGEGKALYPKLIVLPSDPEKYRFVNRRLVDLLNQYTASVTVKSIDEMVLEFDGMPALERYKGSTEVSMSLSTSPLPGQGSKAVSFAMQSIGKEIKRRIKDEIGEWLTVSIGIAPNHYLAKVASGLHKPDGLDEINSESIESILGSMKLEDLCGIKDGFGGRLRNWGLGTPLAFYNASAAMLVNAFHSVTGHQWWLRLHGFPTDDWDFERKSVGHSYAFYKPYEPTDTRTHQILCQLVEKMGQRLRGYGLTAQGIHVSCYFTDHSFWNHGQSLPESLFASRDLYKQTKRILLTAPALPIRILAVSCFRLLPRDQGQLSLFDEDTHKRALVDALDSIHNRWGDFMVYPASMLGMEHKVLDRIAFGGAGSL